MVQKVEVKKEGFFKKYQDIVIPIGIVLFVVLLAVILFLVFGKSSKEVVTKDEEKPSAVTEKGVVKDEVYQGLKFTNATLIKDKGIYTLSVDVKNESKEKSTVTMVNIPIKDKDGNEIITLLGYIGKELGPGETATVTASTSADLSNAYTKEIVEKKVEPANAANAENKVES